MRRTWILISCVVVLAAATFVSAQQRAPEAEMAKPKAQREAIVIRGKAENLYPGRSALIGLRLRNRSGRALVVKSVRARVRNAGPGCSKKNLTTRRKKLTRRIPARSVRRARLRVTMSADAADACQGAKFPLRYRARVRR